MLLQTVIETLIQLILFTSIPLIWWLCTERKKQRFLHWLGLKTPQFKAKAKAVIVSALAFVLWLFSGLYLISNFENKSLLANAKFLNLGLGGIIPVLIYSIIQTGLCEEIFFRGFSNKRLSSKFGFITGNTIQSVVFGLLHGILIITNIDLMMVIIIVGFTSIVGWFMGYINEKLGNGSIIPSWIIHSLINIASSITIIFI